MTKVVVYDDVSQALSTLATGAVIGTTLKCDGARNRGVMIEKFIGSVVASGGTAGEGPLRYGLAKSDLTNAEIAEALTADPQDEGDTPAAEQSNRSVLAIGVLPVFGAVDEFDAHKYTDLHWPWKRMPEHEGIKFWVQNLDAGTLTTGVLVEFQSVMVSRWLDD